MPILPEDMTLQKTVFVIPGFKQNPTSRAYKEIVKILKKEGYSPVLINIPWKQTTISENTEYFLKKYKKVHSRNKYILGFSFGAMIAFLASTKMNTKGIILCSLSPYFKEDMFKIKNEVSKHRYRDFSTLNSTVLAKQIKAQRVLMLYGTKEAKSLVRRVRHTYRHLPSVRKLLVPVQETEHNIGDKKYLHKIHQMVKVLN